MYFVETDFTFFILFTVYTVQYTCLQCILYIYSDATGMLVIPGGIDSHTHCQMQLDFTVCTVQYTCLQCVLYIQMQLEGWSYLAE